MKPTRLFLMMGVSALLLVATRISAAQAQCGPHADVAAHLARVYSETRQMIGLGADNTVIEVFAAESGSWTVLVTRAGGAACIVAAGENFQLTQETLPLDDQGT